MSYMTFTKEQEAEGRKRAKERLASGPVYYNRNAQTNEPAELVEHTEETLWPYCIPVARRMTKDECKQMEKETKELDAQAAKDDLKIWIAQVLERGHLTVEIIEDARRLLRDNQQKTSE